MASPSSSPSSSSISWNHDVFLSFRGEDTRSNFVDHLYTSLQQAGIYTYKDDEQLPRGESIGPSLLKAIQESRIAIIVFSKRYANSSWCLDELVHIIKCKERGQIVMPIFYHVNPSDVRKQKGEFGIEFAKLMAVKNDDVGPHRKNRKRNHGTYAQCESENKKVESWRMALSVAGNLSGWVPSDIANGHESKCIKQIVNTILQMLLPPNSGADKNLIGIEARKKDLKSKLEIGSGGVLMVGIWGVGGGGKTTLATSVYDEVSGNFDCCCIVENIRKSSNKYGLENLQEKILSCVLKREQVTVTRIEEGKLMIKRMLFHRKVLLLLDDVDDVGQLEALSGSHDWFGEGSRIIITTRDAHVLNTHKVDVIHNISLLNDREAIELFNIHARPPNNNRIKDYELFSKDVVAYAGGLPLSLKVLGSFLCDKDWDEWRSALNKLQEIPDSNILETQKISYDGLDHLEKELFLEIACLYTLRPKDWVMIMLDACGFHPIIGVTVLIQKALITILNGRIYMHDVLQELGHYIVRGKYPNNPEKHSRVWKKEDVLQLCAMEATTDNDTVEALRLDCFIDDPTKNLPCVVANMKRLRCLYWEGYPESLLTTSFQPKKLCCLVMENSLQKQLWRGSKYLPSLKVLDLRDSNSLIKTPDFKGLPRLERLILKDCSNLKEIHWSIGYHKKIIYLDMKGCSRLKKFPPIFHMKKLETLILSSCFQLSKFPVIKTSMNSLKNLSLAFSGIEVLPSSVGKYCKNLISLDLSDCCYLKSIEDNFHPLRSLSVFHLQGCTRLEKLPECLFERECQIQELSLCQSSYSVHSVIDSFRNLMNDRRLQFYNQDLVRLRLPRIPCHLRKLSLKCCNLADGDISSDICELSNLQELDLSENKFSRLDSTLSQLPHLKFLNLSDCQNLVELPVLPSSIAVLKAYRCDSLEITENLPANYQWLWKISLWRKKKLIGGEKVLQSVLQGNAIEAHFLSIRIGRCYDQSSFDWIHIDNSLAYRDTTFTLQLPQNWYNNFSGFLICVANHRCVKHTITIRDEMLRDNQSDDPPWVEFDKTPEFDTNMEVGYISFGSLRHTSWWNSSHSKISFFLESLANPGFKVGLVPRKSDGDPTERAQSETYRSEYWDEGVEDRRTFLIQHDSESCLKIFWSHRL